MGQGLKKSVGLKNCPFCGGGNPFVERADYSSCYVVCNDCGSRGPQMCQESDRELTPGRKAARKAWNERLAKKSATKRR
jgi:Lar family restriction alleviation protein